MYKNAVKIYSSETGNTFYGEDYDAVYTDLHDAGKFVKGYWVAEESLAWIEEHTVGHYFIVENNVDRFEPVDGVLPIAQSRKKVVLFAEVADATHFKMVWI